MRTIVLNTRAFKYIQETARKEGEIKLPGAAGMEVSVTVKYMWVWDIQRAALLWRRVETGGCNSCLGVCK